MGVGRNEMRTFEIFTVITFVVVFMCLGFLMKTVLYHPEPEQQLINEIDLEELFPNEFIYIADKPEGITYQEYLSNLDYFKQELYNTFKSSAEVASFLYYDIITGYTFSFNPDVEVPTSSSIKASMSTFVLDLVSQGKADLTEKLTYTEDLFNPGSGRIKNHTVGTQYTVDQLLEYMMVDSDNMAYLMLLRRFGYKNSQAYWFSHGTTTTYKSGTSWGTINANDALVYMRRLYSFYLENEEYGPKLMDLFKRARFRFLFRNVTDLEVAHKSGSTTASTNDLSLVLDKHPYIFVVLTRKNAELGHADFFAKVSKGVQAFHKYYWDNIGYSYTP